MTDPRMHTAEHILNQTMDRLFGCGRCFNAHIGRKKSKCDYHLDRPLEPYEISEIEAGVKAAIDADLAVTAELITSMDAQGKYDMTKVPDHTGDTIRIVHIGDYDACPCIGPHVEHTGEIGQFRITTSDYADGRLRIRYKLG